MFKQIIHLYGELNIEKNVLWKALLSLPEDFNLSQSNIPTVYCAKKNFNLSQSNNVLH